MLLTRDRPRAATGVATGNADGGGAVDYAREAGRGTATDELAFSVLGSAGEVTGLTMVTPRGVIMYVESVGNATVRCNEGACHTAPQQRI